MGGNPPTIQGRRAAEEREGRRQAMWEGRTASRRRDSVRAGLLTNRKLQAGSPWGKWKPGRMFMTAFENVG
jgi:hypothetical protein